MLLKEKKQCKYYISFKVIGDRGSFEGYGDCIIELSTDKITSIVLKEIKEQIVTYGKLDDNQKIIIFFLQKLDD